MVGGQIVLIYSQLLYDSINDEKKGIDYICQGNDRKVLVDMLAEINMYLGTNLHYLAEIDLLDLKGSGVIMANYLDKFQSDSVRCYLAPQIAADKVSNGAEILLRSYLHFRDSKEYISLPDTPSPAHIYTRYDNAISKLKPRKLKKDLLTIVANPRDAFYLPLTTRMLALWKVPELERVLMFFLNENNITNELVGLPRGAVDYYPPLSFIRKQLKLMGIDNLKYYPSENVVNLLNMCAKTEDKDITSAINKSLKYIKKKVDIC